MRILIIILLFISDTWQFLKQLYKKIKALFNRSTVNTYYFFDSAEPIPESHLTLEMSKYATYVYNTLTHTFSKPNQSAEIINLGWLACELHSQHPNHPNQQVHDLTPWVEQLHFETKPPTAAYLFALYRIEHGIYVGPRAKFIIINNDGDEQQLDSSTPL